MTPSDTTHERRTSRLKIHHILFGFLIFALMTSLLRNMSALDRNQYFLDQLKREYLHERARSERLELTSARSRDPYEIERLVRDKLGYIREGEQVIIIATPTPTPSAP